MRIDVIMGTRPGIVKMAPVYQAFSHESDFEVKIVYTGQHYSETLKENIWAAFDLPAPRSQIDGIANATSHCKQIAEMMVGCEKAFEQNNTDLVLVCGDANTNLAAALAARKLDLKLGHVESGLRSRDWRMPEEHNRVMIDHISDYLFSPTSLTSENLRAENVQGKILECGNTVVDALFFVKNKLDKSSVPGNLPPYVVFTAHRQENVDNVKILRDLCEVVVRTSERIKVIFPVHPRTLKMLKRYNLINLISNRDNVSIVEPLPYFEMLGLLINARCVLTDSGGLQEESCILGVPCITLRENTERPETVNVGANVIGGTDPDVVLNILEKRLSANKHESWDNPFGQGDTSKKIVKFVSERK